MKERITVGGVYLDHNFSRLGNDQFWDTLKGLFNGWMFFNLVSVRGDVQSIFCRKHPDYNTLPLETPCSRFLSNVLISELTGCFLKVIGIRFPA